MEKEKEYERICKKLGFIPSEFKAPDFETEDDFARFMDFVKSASLHESDVTVTGDDHLLTLITCDRTYGGADGRFVVMAVREDL